MAAWMNYGLPGERALILRKWDNESLFPMIRKLQPQILITKRCGGWGDFNTPEQHIGTTMTRRHGKHA